MTRSAKITALENLINQVEHRAKNSSVPFDRLRLPGKKRDLLILARNFSPLLETISEASFEEYMRSLNCRFPNAKSSRQDFFYRQKFPEFFN